MDITTIPRGEGLRDPDLRRGHLQQKESLNGYLTP